MGFGTSQADTVSASTHRSLEFGREQWLTLAAVVVLQLVTVLPEVDAGRNDGSLVPPLLGFIATSALLWHRHHLAAVVGVAGVCSVVGLVLFPQTVPAVIAADLVITNLVAARAPTPVAVFVSAVFTLLTVAMVFVGMRYAGSDGAQAAVVAALLGGLMLGSWALGQLRRGRAHEVVWMRERMRQVEVERVQAEQIAALTERTRLAREMHDIVAHSVSGLVALADGGRYAAATDPRAAVEVLANISHGGRETLGQLRSLISALRDPEQQPSDTMPGIEDIPDLVASTASRGVEVELRCHGAARPVPPALGLAAYRIVQEALTNVVKHAGLTARAAVTLDWRDDFVIEIRDNGQGLKPSRIPLGQGGAGLVGMRERTEALAGMLQAGPQPEGGFRVQARIPLPAAVPGQS